MTPVPQCPRNLLTFFAHHQVMLAVQRLGLSSLKQFDPNKRIIEYIIALQQQPVNTLISGSLESFIMKVASRSPAPGGGSVAACAGALGAGLGAMVAWLSYGSVKWLVQQARALASCYCFFVTMFLFRKLNHKFGRFYLYWMLLANVLSGKSMPTLMPLPII